MKRTTRIRAAVGALTAAVALGPAVAAPASAAPPHDPTVKVPAVDWKPCPDLAEVDCGSVTVPIDWSKPYGETVDIALARQKATDPAARIGSILINPGGPGGSGVDWAKGGPIFSPEVHRRFDVVGFDPRGVGGSHPVLCDLDIEVESVPPVPRDRAEFDAVVAHNKALGDSCRKLTGPLFDFVDTASVTRDMDAIRAALGEHKLNYYGVSYGTLMGQQYAELFPRRIRTMVIDSNMDHSLRTTWQFLQTEATAAQENFDQFITWCGRTAACALHGQDVRKVFGDLYARAGRGELTFPGSDIKIEQFQLLSFTNGSFYGPSWQFLADFLKELSTGQPNPAIDQRAAAVLAGSRTAGSRIGDRRAGHGEPVPDPFSAVFCQDWRLPVHDFVELEAYRRALTLVAPDMKLSPLGWGATTSCLGWPARVRNPQHRLEVASAPPILMLNSRYDPATPYQWATNASRQMGAALLTYDGWGHGSYFKGSSCVTGAVDTYFLTGATPNRGTHCPAVEPPTEAQLRTQSPTRPRWPLTDTPTWTTPHQP
ncbi:alpha/beta hydrolase [Planosporangium flavigriseum]|uniref:Peptidase n=1 Tax=Planosporangium flavigriseum TaxID=373681 RepID=A0A8J3LYR8_9ACTN|nr:alpha/beta hydrolase [Planosporangium flavigriseum]NJC67674.1 alpha/beta hydrolase [Planosporangium flavigriseum]GIG75850.1 peptidase [Planosporangium flavigriseum]